MKTTLQRITTVNALFMILFCITISCVNDEDNVSSIEDIDINIPDDGENEDPVEEVYIAIPDGNFEQILINQGIDSDGKINQLISKPDAEKISELDLDVLRGSAIYDLTGIEGFVNLKKLSVYQHNIDRIDLSSNILLDSVYLIANYITTIDVSNNPNLILLDVQSNMLRSIKGISNATHLKNLDASHNFLEEFSTHNEYLEVLHMSHNDLTSINLNGAIRLRNILLTTNLLTTIDLSTNTSLETLLILDNKIQNISLENNTNVTHLYISGNSLLNLDVSNNQKLFQLKCEENPDLTCIKIKSGQEIPSVLLSDTQELNSDCN
jgi:Leucine-rich repeat (LRR) protein